MELIARVPRAGLTTVGSGRTIAWLLGVRAADRPNHPFLVWEPFSGAGRSWSYAEFARDVAVIAEGLRRRGVGAGDMARETGAPLERTNVNGGAIALGHPLGAIGTILAAKTDLRTTPHRRTLRTPNHVRRRRPSQRHHPRTRLRVAGLRCRRLRRLLVAVRVPAFGRNGGKQVDEGL
jgi:hypothetical protein